MAREGAPFHGILFCGMMMAPQPDGSIRPMVLEFNARFGDPETQAILVRLQTDIVEVFDAAIDGTADRLAIRMKPGASVCVIAASGGYPGKIVNGKPINGLDSCMTRTPWSSTPAPPPGTAQSSPRADASSPSPRSPMPLPPRPRRCRSPRKAYAALGRISFEGMQFRRDIGWRALRDGCKARTRCIDTHSGASDNQGVMQW